MGLQLILQGDSYHKTFAKFEDPLPLALALQSSLGPRLAWLKLLMFSASWRSPVYQNQACWVSAIKNNRFDKSSSKVNYSQNKEKHEKLLGALVQFNNVLKWMHARANTIMCSGENSIRNCYQNNFGSFRTFHRHRSPKQTHVVIG